MTTQTINVTGMTCEHCVQAVTKELTALEGVQSVDINLQPGGSSVVTVNAAAEISPSILSEAVDEAGYEVSQ